MNKRRRVFKCRRILSVDPGDSTGWAYWRNSFSPETGQITLDKNKCTDVLNQLQSMWLEFDILLTRLKPDVCVLEGVEVWEGSLKSHVASKKRGIQEISSLFKLAYLIGGYMNVCDNHNIDFKIVHFREWGGQLKEDGVKAQIEHIMKKKFRTIHIYCAVGIGLNYLGKF